MWAGRVEIMGVSGLMVFGPDHRAVAKSPPSFAYLSSAPATTLDTSDESQSSCLEADIPDRHFESDLRIRLLTNALRESGRLQGPR